MGYDNELGAAIDAAREAGEWLREELHRGGGPRGHGEHADADAEAERIVRTRLLGATAYSYQGEELGTHAGADTSHKWVVDPNDGTASFLKGQRGASVSIALVRGDTPVLGVVYAYAYPDDDGDLIAWAEGAERPTRNGVPSGGLLADVTLGHDAVVLVSQVADRRPVENGRCVAPGRFLAMPSIAYRLALVAAGEGVAAVSLSGPVAWDYAAGHALVRAVHGDLVDQDQRPVAYEGPPRAGASYCFGGAPAAARTLAQRGWGSVFGRGASGSSYAQVRTQVGRLVRDAGMLRRAQGCMLGQLAGDALGSLVEFQSAERIAMRYPDGVHDLVDGGTWDTIAGQPTDDSEMAIMLARSIVQHGGYQSAAALDAYVHWYRSRPFDMGGTTAAALRAASQAPAGERLLHVAEAARGDSQANGSLMRISPIGILGAGRPGEAVAWARADSGLTHPHPVCREACAAFVAALAAGIGGAGPVDAWKAAREEALRGGEELVIEALDAAKERPPESFSRSQGWVRTALWNAFYRLLHASSLEEGVTATVTAGGDTDTNGAIAGALLGAVHGRDAVPARWRSAVLTCRPMQQVGARQARPKELWPVDAMAMAEVLLAIGLA